MGTPQAWAKYGPRDAPIWPVAYFKKCVQSGALSDYAINYTAGDAQYHTVYEPELIYTR